MTEKNTRLRPKYHVQKLIRYGGEVIRAPSNSTKIHASTNPDSVDSPFVLMPRKDPAAFAAMLTYMRYCEPELASEIRVWLEKIAAAPAEYGTQGQRNITHMKADAIHDIF